MLFILTKERDLQQSITIEEKYNQKANTVPSSAIKSGLIKRIGLS